MVSSMILARENRIMIEELQKVTKEIKIGVEKMINHYSKRLPGWATVIITILGSIVVGFIVGGIK